MSNKYKGYISDINEFGIEITYIDGEKERIGTQEDFTNPYELAEEIAFGLTLARNYEEFLKGKNR